MTDYRLTSAAADDIREIGEYTTRIWGATQRKIYLSELIDRLDRIARHPEAGLDRDDIRPGLRCVAFRRHMIFYGVASDGIEIVRILHGSRDISFHMREV